MVPRNLNLRRLCTLIRLAGYFQQLCSLYNSRQKLINKKFSYLFISLFCSLLQDPPIYLSSSPFPSSYCSWELFTVLKQYHHPFILPLAVSGKIRPTLPLPGIFMPKVYLEFLTNGCYNIYTFFQALTKQF